MINFHEDLINSVEVTAVTKTMINRMVSTMVSTVVHAVVRYIEHHPLGLPWYTLQPNM